MENNDREARTGTVIAEDCEFLLFSERYSYLDDVTQKLVLNTQVRGLTEYFGSRIVTEKKVLQILVDVNPMIDILLREWKDEAHVSRSVYGRPSTESEEIMAKTVREQFDRRFQKA